MSEKGERSHHGRDLTELRQKLEERRRELTQQVFAKLRDVRAESTLPQRSLEEDFGAVDLRDDLVTTIIEMKSETLNRIEEALRQIEHGRYGVCAECGGHITENPLLALPFALRCTPCEEAHETQSQSVRRVSALRPSAADFRNW